MDLSHWNLVQRFTLIEAASLAAGVDPKLPDGALTPEQLSKRSTIFDELWKSCLYTIQITQDILDIPFEIETGERRVVKGALVSAELYSAVKEATDTGSDTLPEEMLRVEAVDTMVFDREELQQWFLFRGYEPSYTFSEEKASNAGGKPSADVPDAPLHSRERNSFLRLILALAFSIEGFDPKHPYTAAGLIKKETNVPMSKEWIAQCIQKAHELHAKERKD